MIIKQSPKIRHIRCFLPIVTIEEVSYYKGITDIDFTSPGTLKKKKIMNGLMIMSIKKFTNHQHIERQIMFLMRQCLSYLLFLLMIKSVYHRQ